MNTSRNVGIADPKLDTETCAGKSTIHGFSVEPTPAISSCFSNLNDCTDCRRSKEIGCTLGPEHLVALPLASRKDGIEVSWARSSAVEHYVDIVGATGSIPVAPTIQNCKLGAGNEGQEFTALAQIAASQLSNRTPQGAGLCDQQAAKAFQGKAGLTPNPACSHPAKPCVDAVIRCCYHMRIGAPIPQRPCISNDCRWQTLPDLLGETFSMSDGSKELGLIDLTEQG